MRKTIAVLLILGFCLPLVAVPMPNTLKGYMKLFKPGMTKAQVQKVTRRWGLVDVTDQFKLGSSQNYHFLKSISLYKTRFSFLLAFNDMDYLENSFFLIVEKDNATKKVFEKLKRKIQSTLKKSLFFDTNEKDNEKSCAVMWEYNNKKIVLFYGFLFQPKKRVVGIHISG